MSSDKEDLYRYETLKKSNGLAVALELLGGGLFQVFGIGNFYGGNPVAGVALMVSYWVIQGINLLLMMVFVGFITWPLTWLIYMILGAFLASGAVDRHNRELAYRFDLKI